MTRSSMFITLIAPALALLTPSVAAACKYVMPATEADRRVIADQSVRNAPIIIDAEVIRPSGSSGQPALLVARRVIKGPPGQKVYAVAVATSCDMSFPKMGARQRVFLHGGPKVYHASQNIAGDPALLEAIARMRRR